MFALIFSLLRLVSSSGNPENYGICGFVSSTNIKSVEYHSMWSCTDGIPDSDPCTWRDLHCEGDLLSKVELYNLGLTGNIPESVGSLTSLTSLMISFNYKFSGTIPSSVGELTALKSLTLSTNQLSGTIPSTLVKLANLYDLKLYNNQLSGSIPHGFSNIKGLQSMVLSSNRLSGTIPNDLGDIKDLALLNVGYNLLSGAVPVSLCTSGGVSTDIILGNTSVCFPVECATCDCVKVEGAVQCA